ncbi:MAG: hypothetical protein SCARUB_01541 [Candidatus Scalindua rubra]|uniref:Uncharacterized protein n=1 Tax=Candidatus Scalindua rubra TaxID=1872076 RepID=A0A1E3XCH0_9BACT|nr:MAG: hypothetical protein SCARUB_01541 [Candidatus Scalindua rubra]
MQNSKISIKDIAEKLGRGAKVVSEEIKGRIPLYLELLKTLANIGKNISLDVDKGIIKIKEGFINDYLNDVSIEDKGLQSIKISCKEGSASFLIKLKRFLFEGVIEIPFTVESFIFSKDKRTVTFKFGDKKVDKVNNYYSKILFWFSLSIVSIFYKKEERIKKGLFHQDSIMHNPDGTHTIDLNKIPELREVFKKDMAKIRYWDLISMDKLSFEKGLIILRLSRKLATIIKTFLTN